MKEKADSLLWEWYLYAKPWRPKLGFPRCDPACRQSVSSRQWDNTQEIVSDLCDSLEMVSVEWCYDELDGKFQKAIGIEMKNREIRANVWRSGLASTYDEALEAIMPLMRKKNLI